MSLSRTMKAALLGGVASMALLAPSTTASADTVVGADYNLAVPLDGDASTGHGVALRAGQRLDLTPLTLTGELMGDYHTFGGTMDPHTLRGMVGGRVGIGAILRPHAFAHLGIGRLNGRDIMGVSPSRTAFTYDLGVGLDLTLLPVLNVGAHIAYNRISGNDRVGGFDWFNFGLHADLIF